MTHGDYGHGAIIDHITGTQLTIVNQNTSLKSDIISSATITSGSLASGNATLTPVGWAGYTIQGVIHHPKSSGGGTQTPPWPGVGDDLYYGDSKLDPGDIMYQDQYLPSPDLQYALVLQHDGNLVLCHGKTYLWQSNTDGMGVTRLVMQGDGNLVLYTTNGTPKWSSGTSGKGLSSAVMQDDGNFVIYRASNNTATWNSRTGNHEVYLNYGPTSELNAGSGNASMWKGQYLRSPDRRYAILLQPDHNFVLWPGLPRSLELRHRRVDSY